MSILKNVDEKIKEIGFIKISENKYAITYGRHNAKYGYYQCVDILHKASGKSILQSYDKNLMDEKKIGNTCVGLTGYEMSLFIKKMKKWGRLNRRKEVEC